MSNKQPTKTDLMEWINTEGDNFLGTDMSIHEWLQAHGIADYKASWKNQDRPERKRRLHFVIDMAIEKRRLEIAHGRQHDGVWYMAGGAYMDMAIEAVIVGNRYDLRTCTDMCGPKFLLWNYGKEEGKKIAEWYAPFYQLCEQCLASWPSEEEKAQA